MGRVFKPSYTKPDGSGGRAKVQVKDWYVEYTDENGVQQRERVGPDKRLAETALGRITEQVARRRLGLSDPAAEKARSDQSIRDLVTEYLDELANRGRSDRDREGVSHHLAYLGAQCKWVTWSDVTGPPVLKALADMMRGDETKSPTTVNNYMRSAKGFANWHADRLEARSPLKSLKFFNEEVDRRRSKRVLTDEELLKLIAAAQTAPNRHNTIIVGPDRAVLYRVAAYTGLRASDLASLEPKHFTLDGEPPLVTVEAKYSKSGREEPIPLHPELLAFLRTWLPTRKVGVRLWPGDWADDRRQATWIKRDAKRAGLGKGVHMHGLKRKFVTGLMRSGADVDLVRRLARHTNLQTTLDHYTGTKMSELAQAVSKLPGLDAKPPAAS